MSQQEAGWRRIIPSWPLIMSVVALLLAYRPKQLLGDPDTYLHIVAGNWMLAHRALPSQDQFSWSLAGAHWVVHEWLAELTLALVQGWLGWAGLALVTALCFALAIGLMTRAILRKLEPLIGPGFRLYGLVFAGAASAGPRACDRLAHHGCVVCRPVRGSRCRARTAMVAAGR